MVNLQIKQDVMEAWNGGHLESSGKPVTYLNLELGIKG